MTVMAMSVMGKNDKIIGGSEVSRLWHLRCGASPVNASQAFEHLIPMTKLQTPTTKAFAAHYNPLEGPIGPIRRTIYDQQL